MKRIRTWGRYLWEPAPEVQGWERRHHSRILMRLLIVFMPVAFVMAIYPVATRPGARLWQDSNSLSILAGMVGWLVAYRLAQQGRYELAAMIVAFAGTLTVQVAAVLDNVYNLIFFLLPILLAATLLPLRTAVVILNINLITFVALATYFQVFDSLTNMLLGPVVFMVIGTIMIFLTSHHRDQVAEHRRKALEASESRLRLLGRQLHLQAAALEAAANAIVITDVQGTIEWCNPAFLRLTGYTLKDVVGKNPRILKSGLHDNRFYYDLWSTILAGQVWHGEIRNRRHDGTIYIEEMTITPLSDGNEITHFIAVKHDISDRKALEDRLSYEATHDAVTGLANRSFFMRRLEAIFTRLNGDEQPFALFYLDLDHFKRINDTWGHAAGDELLGAIAKRLRSCLRPSDLAARIGGDEFTILLESTAGEAEAVAVAQRIQHALHAPVELAGGPVAVQASIGIVLGPADYTSTDLLLQDADAAMYQAKAQENGAYILFQPRTEEYRHDDVFTSV